jgi:WhiB family redox-sensing transcriptional regulator
VLTDWRESSRCKEMDPDLFFPVGTTGPALLQIEAAKAVCRQCNVRENCLGYALDSNQEYGIWGATTEEERRYMRRELTSRIAH